MVGLFLSKYTYKSGEEYTDKYTIILKEKINESEFDVFFQETINYTKIVIDSILFNKLETIISFCYYCRLKNPEIVLIIISYFDAIKYEMDKIGIMTINYEEYKENQLINIDKIIYKNKKLVAREKIIESKCLIISIFQLTDNCFAKTFVKDLLKNSKENSNHVNIKFQQESILFSKNNILNEKKTSLHFTEINNTNYLQKIDSITKQTKVNYISFGKIENYHQDLFAKIIFQSNLIIIFVGFSTSEDQIIELRKVFTDMNQKYVFIYQKKIYINNYDSLEKKLYITEKIKYKLLLNNYNKIIKKKIKK